MKPPAFQFYADDFLAGTADMTNDEVGAYIRLLCHQWSKGGLPNDSDRLSRMAGAMPVPSLGYVLAKFRQCDDGQLRNDRLEAERQKQDAYRAEQSKKGKKGAEQRWKNDSGHAPAIAAAMPVPSSGQWQNDGSPSPSPSPIKHTPTACAERPSLEEVRTAAQFIGLAPWKAEDWFNEMEGGGWLDYNHRPVANWKAVLNRIRAKWEAEGRPSAPPSGKLNGKPGTPNAASRIGPSLAAVQDYARDKDDGTKRAQAYAVSWWQAWEGRGWKRDGKSIDWQIEFAKAVQVHLQRPH